jgi:hypothetical protein
LLEDQLRSEILKTIPYGFYITGVAGAESKVMAS